MESTRPIAPAAYERIRRHLLDPGEAWADAGASAAIGPYRLLGVLGRGGAGTVYEAVDPRLGRRIALKVLRDGGDESVARFHREAAIAARLGHPNLVAVHDVGTVESAVGEAVHYIAMDRIEGRTLAEVLADPTEALVDLVAMLETVARAVAFAHAQGVVHRDLKPSNVLVETTGRVLLTDFGLARDDGLEVRLTRSDAVFGTPAYMAPEQVAGRVADIGPATDVHGLGVLLYEILTGTVPYRGRHAHEVHREILEAEPVRPSRLAPGVPLDLEAVALRALEKDPAGRYPSAGLLADELARWLEGRPVLVRPPGRARRLARRIVRRPLPWLAGLAVAVAVVGAGWVGLERARDEGRRSEARRAAAEGRALYAAAVLAVQSGDREAGDRLMAGFDARMAEADALDPAVGGGWFERAQYHRLTGDPAAAWRELEAGLALRPDHPLGRIERGLLLLARYREAIEAARLDQPVGRRGLWIHPDSPWGRPVAEIEGQRPELAALRRQAEDEIAAGAAGLGSDLPWVRLALAELAFLGGRLDEADEGLRGLEDGAAKTLRGRIAERRGRLVRAEDWFTRAIHTRSDDPAPWAARALLRTAGASRVWQTEEGRRRLGEALSDWDRAVALLPESVAGRLGRAGARRSLAYSLFHADQDPEPAVELVLEDAERILAGDGERVEALRLRRDACWIRADWRINQDLEAGPALAAAIAAVDALAARLPADADLRVERAFAFLFRAAAAGPGDDPAADFDRALASCDEALAIDPGSAYARYGRGMTLLRLGRRAEAHQAFEDALARTAADREAFRAQLEGLVEATR